MMKPKNQPLVASKKGSRQSHRGPAEYCAMSTIDLNHSGGAQRISGHTFIIAGDHIAELNSDAALDVAVLMPASDMSRARRTARILEKRAGMTCNIYIIQDTSNLGYINTVNAVLRCVEANYIVYLSEHVFPGRNWLGHAFRIMEDSGKSLLGFNNGKETRRNAVIGMVRLAWVRGLYGGHLFFSGYRSSEAMKELTLIAKAADEYVYSPECVLMDVDMVTLFKEDTNPNDAELLRLRYGGGFDGAADTTLLEAYSEEYGCRVDSDRISLNLNRSLFRKSQSSNPRPIIVLGMHRSGTSAVTGVLSAVGVYVGGKTELTPASAENPVGFFERRDMRVLCDYLLHAVGCDWWKVSGFYLDDLPQQIVDKGIRDLSAVFKELDKHGCWAIKEPRICVLLPLLLRVLYDPLIVYAYRNPMEVAKSLNVRNKFPIEFGLALWERYNLLALKYSSGLERIFVSYESLIQRPEESVRNLVTQIKSLYSSDFTENIPLGVAMVRRDLHRQKANVDDDCSEQLSLSQRRIFNILRLYSNNDLY